VIARKNGNRVRLWQQSAIRLSAKRINQIETQQL
jgi:hypothetical protein